MHLAASPRPRPLRNRPLRPGQIRAVVAIALIGACGAAGAWLAEFGIEGMGVVSTPDTEVRATVSPDGQRIVWGSTDRPGGAGGWDLWEARLRDKRWQDPRPLAINGAANDFDPIFSADGRWLYFFSNRDGGLGGDDLYRAAVRRDGSFGDVENLGAGVNTKGNEWAPTPSRDGQSLLFASDGHGGAGRHDLLVARWNGQAFADTKPVPGVNTRADEFDAAWIDDGRGIVFARSKNLDKEAIVLMVAACDGARYGEASPLVLSFNTPDAATLAPVIDWNKPGELLISGKAKAPKAGKMDVYRMKAPVVAGKPGCLPRS
jgi:hypothetical protein